MSPYSLPQIYDIAFDDRDFAGECDFITRIAEKHLGRKHQSSLELACGPGYHAREFANRGLRSLALDNSREMIDYAIARASSDQNTCSFICADMQTFELPERVDCCYTLLCGFAHLLTNEDIIAHFKSVANALTPGGIYLIATAHPRDFYSPFSVSESERSWTNERGDLRVTTTWGGNEERYDPITEIDEIEIQYKIEQLQSGESSTLSSMTRLRRCSYQTFRALVELSGVFDIVAEYGDFAEEIPFSLGEAAGRFLPVLRKR